MDLLRVDPRTLAKAGVRGESFADAFLAAVGSTPEQFMTDPDIRRRLKEASPVFLVSPDDPPAMVVGAGPAETALVPPTVPDTINDPHSAWQMALLADTIRRAGAKVVARLGPALGKNPQADAAAIVAFLNDQFQKGKPTHSQEQPSVPETSSVRLALRAGLVSHGNLSTRLVPSCESRNPAYVTARPTPLSR